MRLRAKETGDAKAHASWLELLLDLVFFAVIGQLAMQLERDASIAGIGRFTLLFVPAWWSWIGLAFFGARFDFDDLLHRALVFLQTAAFAAMALSIALPNRTGTTAFATNYVLLRILLIFSYVRAGRVVPEAWSLIRRYLRGLGLAAVIWAGSLFAQGWPRIALWIIGQIIDCATPFYAGTLHTELPPDEQHLPERFGQLVLIVLGETISITIGSIGPRLVESATASTIAIIALSLLMTWGVWWAYYDAIEQDGGSAIAAAAHEGKVGVFQTWLYSHLPLVYGLTVTGVATRWALLRTPGFGAYQHWVLCLAFACALFGILLVQLTRGLARGNARKPGVRSALSFKAGAVILFVAAAPLGARLPAVALFTLGGVTAAAVIALNIRLHVSGSSSV